MKLIKNILYNTSYQLLALILPLITVPYVSRVLTSEGIGINAYTNSIVTYFSLAAALGVSLYGNREIAFVQRNKEKRSQIFWELVILRAITVLLALLLLGAFILYTDQWKIYYALQSINLIAIAFDISWYYTGIEDFRKIVVRNTVVKLATVVLTFLLVRSKSDLGLYIFLIGFSALIGNLTVWPFLRKEVYQINFKDLKILRHLKPTLALFLPQIIMQIYLSLNKTMLGMMGNIVMAGYFDQSDKIIRVLFTIVAAIGGVFLPRLSSLFSEKKSDEAKQLILKLIDLSVALSMLMIAGIVAVSSTFAVFFFGKEFVAVGPLMAVQSIMILMIAYGNALGTQYMLAARKTREYTLSAVAGLVANIVFNFLLIPICGAMGAVVSTVITEFIVSFVQAYYLKNTFTLKELTIGMWKYFVAAIAVTGVVYFMNKSMPVTFVNYALQGAVGSIIYVGILFLLKASVLDLFMNFRRRNK